MVTAKRAIIDNIGYIVIPEYIKEEVVGWNFKISEYIKEVWWWDETSKL